LLTVHLNSAGFHLGFTGSSPASSGNSSGTSLPSSSKTFSLTGGVTGLSKISQLSSIKVVGSAKYYKPITALTSPIFFSI
jgi:hypothetical protein